VETSSGHRLVKYLFAIYGVCLMVYILNLLLHPLRFGAGVSGISAGCSVIRSMVCSVRVFVRSGLDVGINMIFLKLEALAGSLSSTFFCNVNSWCTYKRPYSSLLNIILTT
jgi:hypothetical protein